MTNSIGIKLIFCGLLSMAFFPIYMNAMDCCCDDAEDIEVLGGDFEFDPVPEAGIWLDYVAGEFLGPWEVISGSVSHHHRDHNGLGTGHPLPSGAHLDLNGFSDGAICQDISGFIVGLDYELVFYYAIHNGVPLATSTVELNGGAVLSETWDATNVGDDSWIQVSYPFVATAETMELCFFGSSAETCCGMLIDDIEILENCMKDEEAPELSSPPSSQTYQCVDDVPDPIDLTITDNCSEVFDIVMSEELSSTDFCLTTITRTWIVEDECGNIATAIEEIFIEDTEPPVIVSPLVDLTVSCDQDGEDLFTNWIDLQAEGILYENCNDTYTITDYQISNFEDCSTHEVFFTFGDFCGNEIFETVLFSIIDTLPPVFDSLPQNISIPCEADHQTLIDDWLSQNAYAEVSDNCTYMIENDFDGNYTESQTVNFVATDGCQNQAMAEATITIAPEITTILIDTFTCDPDQAGIFEITIDNEFCDSLFILDFILLPSDTIIFVMNTCDIMEEGSDTVFHINSFNCDSLVITRSIFTPGDTLYSNLISCDITEEGLDTIYHLNTNNCDSLIIINTTYVEGDTLFNSLPTCEEFLVAIDTQFLLNIRECDSLVITNTYLTVNDTIFTTEYSCDIDQPEITTMTSPGPICDSIFIIETLPLFSDLTELNFITCKQSEVDLFTQNLINADGCDSMVISIYTYFPIDTIFINFETCLLEEVIQDTISNTTGECDSTFVYSTTLLEGNQTLLDSIICDPELVAIDSTVYENSIGCDSLVIIEYLYHPISFELDPIFDPCANPIESSIEIINVQGALQPYQYSLDGIIFSDETIFSSLDAGLYNVYAQDFNGCISEPVEATIENYVSIEVSIPSTINIEQGVASQIFIEFSIEPDTFYWSNSNIVSCTSCIDPFIEVGENTDLTLFIIDSFGCLSSKTIFFDVNKKLSDIWIPNVFSPNGDNSNDIFSIYTNDPLATLEIGEIYDRWGNRIYQNIGPEISQFMWNGTFKGEDAIIGVYVYRLVVIEGNGTRKQLAGDVTLLR